ncbi:hypothetical protein KLP40_16865 [Hymenobacter sp. NST-14]|uniref:hypothetical protein n=1 Tax=Hymenobacter piscis TaxID=2839984 RepID=UPI001C013209|nr:hypothetical protein [Hymenobacter piscis]MBT9394840.1 hypothetical protein [Hymenobacter piscis]
MSPTPLLYATRLIQQGTPINEQVDWGLHNPEPAEEHACLEDPEIEEYGNWHLGIAMSKDEKTKSRYKFGEHHKVWSNRIL